MTSFGSPVPRILDSEDEATWFRDLNKWAECNQGLVDSLDAADYRHVIGATSHINVDERLNLLSMIYRFSDSNKGAVEGLSDTINVLNTEIEYIHAHILAYMSNHELFSPRLVSEYSILKRHARQSSKRTSQVAAIMTWFHGWPKGFSCLLRTLAIATRRLEDVERKRDLITCGQLNYEQLLDLWPTLVSDDGFWQYGFGYERTPNKGGIADFQPPPLTGVSLDEIIWTIRSAAAIRETRRRAALSRLLAGQAGMSDYLTFSFTDTWYHSARTWLDQSLLKKYKPAGENGKKWIDLSSHLKELHDRWTSEAEYQGMRVLTTRTASFWLDNNNRVLPTPTKYKMPGKHTPLCIKLPSI